MKRHASMNRFYRLIRSRVTHAWIVVAENAKGCGKSISGRRHMAATLALLALSTTAGAAPGGGQVVSGMGSIAQSGATTTITQTSQNLSLNWQSFNVAAQETVNFVQPSAGAIAVNRILDTHGTQLLGCLNANGQVYLINPNGILFGQGAQVNVGGLVASTLGFNDASLNDAARSFSGSGTGSVVNRGTINGGYVALLGNSVSNQGSITSNLGAVALGAGSAATLTFDGNKLVQMQIDQNTLNNLAENGGLIRADGGMVLMSAGARDALLASVVNNTGVIEARSVQNVNGAIVLDGGNLGTVSNSGMLDASGKNAGEAGGTVKALGGRIDLLAGANIDVSGDKGGGTALVGGNYQGQGPEQNAATVDVAAGATINADALASGDGGRILVWSNQHTTVDGTFSARGGASGGNGGYVETSGGELTVGSHTRVNTLAPGGKAGEWLLDPNDFIIGDAATQPGDILDTTLQTNLGGGNVAILSSSGGSGTNGDIIVDGFVLWNANTTLTLSAYRHITFSAYGVGLDASPSTSGSIVLRADNTGTGSGTVNMTGNNAANYIAAGPSGTMGIYYNPNSYAAPTDYGQQIIDAVGSISGTLNTYMQAHINNASATAQNKTYNGTTTATLNTPFTLNTGFAAGTPTGATLNAGTASFADKNVGNSKTVTFSGYSASGSVAIGATGRSANYYLAFQPATQTANITPAAITVSGITASNKVYNATTAAIVNTAGAVLTGKLGGDTVTVSATGAFADKNVGNGKTVTLSSSYGGADAGNYSITDQASATANITPASLTVTGVTANNKVYDTTTSATLAGTATVAALGGDTVSVSGTGSGAFANKTVGNGKAVTVTGYTLSGADAGNYTIVQPAGVTANITPANLAVTGVTASNKVYNGTTAATLGGTAAVTALAGDTVTVGGAGSGTFADKNVGNGKTVTVTGFTLGGVDSGNYTIVQPAGVTADITPKALSVSGITAGNKTYNGTTAATANAAGAVLTGLVGGDTVTVSATGAFADKNVGNGKTVTLSSSYGGADAGNYSITDQASTTANITPKALSISGITAANKVYDATTTATANTAGAVLTGLVGGDTVTVSATGTFADKNVGNGKTVTLASSYGGADAGNYTITDQANTTANITPKALTLGGITASNKVYDGTTTAALNTAAVTFTGLLGGDTVTLGGAGSGTFADKNVGNGKAVTVSGYTLGGVDAANYSVGQPAGLTANITAKALSVSGITAGNKTYNGTTAATANAAGAVLTGLVGGDTVTVSATGTFADKNVGNGKTVTLSSSYGGADAGNYSITDQASTTANITPKALSISGITAANKVYDATTTATANTAGAVLTGLVGGDTVTVSATGTFADKNVGNGKTVTLASSYGGADAGNYTITDQANTTANITPKALTLGGITASNKVYDTTTTATLNTAAVTFTGLLGGDTVTLGGAGSGAFADKNVGNGKTVTVSGYTLGGVDAGNYTVGQPAGLTANITPAALSISGITASNKVYDATTTAALGGVASITALGGDTVTLGGTGVGAFADKNVGNGKAVTVSGYTLAGADAGNYTVGQPAGLTANITPAALSISGITAADKVYDASTAATVSTAGAIYTGLLGTDTVTVSATGIFADKNVGTGKTVALSSTYGGADAGNYTITGQASTTANITPKALTLGGIAASDKVYDGTTAATLNTAGVTFTGLLGGDAVTLGGAGSGAFADKNVGNGKAVAVAGYALGGADAGNYTLEQPAGLTANITPATLGISGIVAADKVYDASTVATVSAAGAVLTGLLGGDTVTVSATGAFADKNVGNGKTVMLSSTYGGADAGNYTITDQASTTANITPAALGISGIVAANKVYDASTAATVSTAGAVLTGLQGTDTVTVSATGTFADKNAGTGKSVTLNIAYGGADAGNYTIAGQTGTIADITPAVLTVTANPDSKTYDGLAYSGGNGVTYTGLVNGETAAVLGGTLNYGGTSQGAINAGNYTIIPGGLTSDNYMLSYADGTLTIMPSPVSASTSQPAQNTIAQVQSNLLPPQPSLQPPALSLPPAISAGEQGSTDAGSASRDETSPGGRSALVNTMLNIGGMGPTLNIINGGMRLPENMVNVNDTRDSP